MEELFSTPEEFNDQFLTEKSEKSDTPFQKLHTLVNSQEFSEIINQPINKTKGELLMILLKFALTYFLSQTAVTNLFSLVNSLFASPILPESRYLIDTLFNPSSNSTFHGICPECYTYVGIFQQSCKSIRCDLCNIDIAGKDSTYNDFFVYFDINSQISELVESNSDYYCYIMKDRIHEENKFKEIFDGKMYQTFLNSLNESDRHRYLTVTYNTDGAPLYESSKYSIWPIYLQINELPYDVKTNELIVCGLWFGRNKPHMNVFLKPFVENMNQLCKEGVKCNIKGEEVFIKVYTLVCCVDSIARPPMQGLTQFNGKYGCNWCLHPGQWVSNLSKRNGGSHKYPLLDEHVNRQNVEDSIVHMETATPSEPCFGFKQPSILINLKNFNIVEGFTPDPLHIVSNVGKLFATIWFGKKNVSSKFLTQDEINEINSIMKKIKVPYQIGRLTRSLEDKEVWKAREWENWILYYSLPIIYLYLDKKYVSHWLLLVEALYILLKEEITIDELNHADELLHKFVADTQKLYSEVAMTFNVHILLHLARSVYNWGPLFTHSAYSFEAGNSKLLKMIHASKGVHQQVARHIALNFSHLFIKKAVYPNASIQMKNYYDSLSHVKVQNTLRTSKARYFGTTSTVDSAWITKLQLSQNALHFSKMVKDGCLYLSSEKVNQRLDNTFVLLRNGSYANIFKFIVDWNTNQEYVLVQMLQTKTAFPRKHKVLQTIEKICSEKIAISVNEIDKISVSVIVSQENWFICVVPNLLSY